MIVAGIVAEYNPFHNGHLHQIQRIKEKLNPDYIIVALGNNFTQRGDASMIDKFDKTKIALSLGVDLVIEIPTVFSTSSAEHFASAGVRLLNASGIVTHLCFGAESNNLEKIIEISKVLAKEPASFKQKLKEELKSGCSFPVARSNALASYFAHDNEIKEIISMPNNILATEYIKELIKLNSNIKPYLIKRNGPGFYSSEVKDNITSATNIRNLLLDNKDISKFVPDVTLKTINENMKTYNKKIVTIDDFSDIVLYNLKTKTRKELSNICEVKEGLEKTLIENSKEHNLISNIIEASKSKRFTYTSISRVMTYILLNITKDSFKESQAAFPRYIRILGFKEKSSNLVSMITANANKKSKRSNKLEVITNVNKFMKQSKNKYVIKELEKEIMYNNIYHIKLDNKTNSDYTQKLIVM